MLLSFQRPSRPLGKGIPSKGRPRGRGLWRRTKQSSTARARRGARVGPGVPAPRCGSIARARRRRPGWHRVVRRATQATADQSSPSHRAARSLRARARTASPSGAGAEVALADLQDAAVEPLGARRPCRRRRAPRRRASRRPGASSRRASERESAERVGDHRRHVHRAAVGRERGSSTSSGASCVTNTRSKCCLGRRRGLRRRGSARRSPRASARLASRGPVPAGGRVDGQQREPGLHRLVGQAHRLAVLSSGGSVTPMWLPSDFDIFSTPSMPGRIGIVRIDLLGLAVGALDVAAEQQVEGLVGPAELDVGVGSPPSRSPAAADTAVSSTEIGSRARRSAWRSRRARGSAPRSRRARARRAPRRGMSSHSPLRRTSSSSGSSRRIVNACSW